MLWIERSFHTCDTHPRRATGVGIGPAQSGSARSESNYWEQKTPGGGPSTDPDCGTRASILLADRRTGYLILERDVGDPRLSDRIVLEEELQRASKFVRWNSRRR